MDGSQTRLCILAPMLFVLCMTSDALAQLTPPGLGNAHRAAWTALGIKEHLHDGRVYTGYVGLGTTSRRADGNPYDKPAILVINHELSHAFHPSWLYAIGLSYRRQNSVHGADWEPERLEEFRLYGRYALVLDTSRVKFQATLRPELRGFVTPEFESAEEPFQLRLRVKTQLAAELDASGKHRLIGGAEALSSVSRARHGFTEFGYRESRFSAFYSVHANDHLVLDIGYMNDLIGDHAPFVDVHYVAFDVIWIDLFRHAQPRRPHA